VTAEALVRDVQRELLVRMLHEGDQGDGGLACVVTDDGTRRYQPLDEPAPDDHRIAHLEREAAALVALHGPVAIGVATVIHGVTGPEETVGVWVAERGGETLTMRFHRLQLSDGLLVPGPLARVDEVQRELAGALVRELQT